ncbi:MAG: hypothetical protein ABJZ55_16135 [Fuerstiella sp.]
MQSLLIASSSEFSLDHIAEILDGKFQCTQQVSIEGLVLLTLSVDGRFVTQLAICDELENRDTMDDFVGVDDVPQAFTDALEAQSLKFLVCTYNLKEWSLLWDAMKSLQAAGVVKFYIDAVNWVHLDW